MPDLRPVKEAAKLMGKHEKTLRRNVRNSTCPGKFVGSKCFVDVTGFVPETELNHSEERKVQETPPEVQNVRDSTALATAEAERLIAETAKIDAQNKRDEAQGLRDKPDELKAREDSLNLLEQQLKEREARVAVLESDATHRYETIKQVELQTRNQVQQAQAECEELRSEADEYVSEKEAELWVIEEEIRKHRYTLNQLEAKEEVELTAFTGKISEIKENLKLWLAYTLKHAGRYTKLGERKGKQNDSFTALGASLWDCHDVLKDIMAWLDETEKSVDANPDETQVEYEKQTNPEIAKVRKILTNAKIVSNGTQPANKSTVLRKLLGR